MAAKKTVKKASDKKVWEKKAPKNTKSIKLTAAQKAAAKKRADKAGRRYPNLVDNMWAAKLAKVEKDLP